MRFSLSMRPMTDAPVTANDIARYAALAERLGYHAIYATDHHYYTNAKLHSVSAVAALAGATKTIKLGFAAYQLPLRHPIAAAKELSVLDALSDGRLVPGLAAGSWSPEFDAFGLPFQRRGAMFDEALQAIKLLWSEEKASFSGEFWSFEDVQIIPKPVQKPHLPIWIGTWTAVPRAARRVVRHAAGWQASGLHTPVEAIPQGLEQIERACAELGRDPREIGKAYVNAVVHFGATPDKAWEDFTARSSRSRHRELCLLGTTQDVLGRIEAIRAQGMEEISFLLGLDALETVERIAKEIMPQFR